MELARLESIAGTVLVISGLAMAIASVIAVGEAQSWDVADAFAADSARPIRKVGMLLGAVSLACLVVTVPVLVARLYGTPGFTWAASGWVAFAGGTSLYMLVLGVVSIGMPALGQLAVDGGVSPQQVADQFVRQPAIAAAFVGANASYLSWIPIGIAVIRSGLFPPWLGWVLAVTAIAAWLAFLHVPVFQRFAGPFWPLAIAVLGVHVLRLDPGTA